MRVNCQGFSLQSSGLHSCHNVTQGEHFIPLKTFRVFQCMVWSLIRYISNNCYWNMCKGTRDRARDTSFISCTEIFESSEIRLSKQNGKENNT